MTIRLNGDGCRYCQPQTYIDHLEMAAAENLMEVERLEMALGSEIVKVATLRHAIHMHQQSDFNADHPALAKAMRATDNKEQ
ncbi:hypothetical protein CAL22_08765 [Bordetella genomosp. 12]|uniref:Uncharacterized protein n=1 Tax=Bordetella genomosp. 12 TaxID=463035 RepID=A0A261VLB3_9BORD|nr:hypothetical protein CAL22_08765 [Bordetella genomosp. 12]